VRVGETLRELSSLVVHSLSCVLCELLVALEATRWLVTLGA